MTNITYFPHLLREYYDSTSSASSSFSEHQTPPQHDGTAEELKVKATPSSSSLSLYTALSKAYSACARPSVHLEEEKDDDDLNSTTVTFLETLTAAGENQQQVRTDEKDSRQELPSKFVSPTSQHSTFKRLSFAKLKTTTRNFGASTAFKDSLIGSVFEAWVDGNKLTATKRGRGCIAVYVKVFNQEYHTEFLGRAKCLAHTGHPNLVRLLGYSLEDTHRLLVYEFTSQGSLEDHLFERSSQNFTWNLCMKVALDAAKGLAFLHSFGKEIIHGNFKPSNILVDSSYNAKLFGFGLTKDRPTSFPEEVLDSVIQDVPYSINSGNIHHAPEYRYTGQFSAKSDVYSFGVVFLEMLCGRRAFEDSRPSEEQNLVEFFDSHSIRNFRIFPVLDSCTTGQYSKNTIQKAVKLVVKCLSLQAKLRPTMDEVVQALEELQN